mmetsp:Transcript_42809/g.118274  ORF Transcript_42809/g.118274 Transcript_42809/m.118274 type:complete len:322 (+) Transcript_42809:864-1829(+)
MPVLSPMDAQMSCTLTTALPAPIASATATPVASLIKWSSSAMDLRATFLDKERFNCTANWLPNPRPARCKASMVPLNSTASAISAPAVSSKNVPAKTSDLSVVFARSASAVAALVLRPTWQSAPAILSVWSVRFVFNAAAMVAAVRSLTSPHTLPSSRSSLSAEFVRRPSAIAAHTTSHTASPSRHNVRRAPALMPVVQGKLALVSNAEFSEAARASCRTTPAPTNKAMVAATESPLSCSEVMTWLPSSAAASSWAAASSLSSPASPIPSPRRSRFASSEAWAALNCKSVGVKTRALSVSSCSLTRVRIVRSEALAPPSSE